MFRDFNERIELFCQDRGSNGHENALTKLRWLKTVIFPWEAWALTLTYAQGITYRGREIAREI